MPAIEHFVDVTSCPVQLGDEVCIFFSCSGPAVLRPQEDGSYMLISLACTDCVKCGEFLDSNLFEAENSLIRKYIK